MRKHYKTVKLAKALMVMSKLSFKNAVFIAQLKEA